MARLTLDENGATRRFKLNPGKLTIGSGDAATLRLTSANVAELHAELVFEAGVARLRPRPGVVPPSLGGKALTAETVLAGGQSVKIGNAVISVEYDEGEGPKTVKAAGAARPAVAAATGAAGARTGGGRSAAPAPRAGGGRTAGARGGAARRGSAADDEDERSARSRRPRARQGVPTWLVLVLVAVAAAFVLYFGRGFLESATSGGFNPVGASIRYRDFMQSADSKGAARVLEEFEKAELSPEWQEKYKAMKAEFGAIASESDRGMELKAATPYYDSQLVNFFNNYLKEKGSRTEARVFVKRLEWFRATYPTHAQIGWVDQMLQRYKPMAQLDQPPTLEDTRFEVKMLTQARPRQYEAAFAVIEEFLAASSGTPRDEGLALKSQLTTEQREFFETELKEAALDAEPGEKQDLSKSFDRLVMLVLSITEQEYVNDAADRMLRFPDVDERLKSYKVYRRRDFDRLLQHPALRSRAESAGLVTP